TGQDDVRIANSNFKRSLNADMGSFDDAFTIQETSVHRRSTIVGGSGTDTLNRENIHGRFKFISFEVVNNSVTSPAPLPPIADSDSASVTRSLSTSINVATNDTSATSTINPASITITQAPAHGTAVANSNGTVIYTNNGNAATSDSFQYTIKDQ